MKDKEIMMLNHEISLKDREIKVLESEKNMILIDKGKTLKELQMYRSKYSKTPLDSEFTESEDDDAPRVIKQRAPPPRSKQLKNIDKKLTSNWSGHFKVNGEDYKEHVYFGLDKKASGYAIETVKSLFRMCKAFNIGVPETLTIPKNDTKLKSRKVDMQKWCQVNWCGSRAVLQKFIDKYGEKRHDELEEKDLKDIPYFPSVKDYEPPKGFKVPKHREDDSDKDVEVEEVVNNANNRNGQGPKDQQKKPSVAQNV